MIVLGDFASFSESIDIKGLKDNSKILINCEGFLTRQDYSKEPVVFNNINLYKEMKANFSLILNLANNHSMDVPDGISSSLDLASEYGLKTVGGGRDLESACKPLVLKDKGVEVSIISAGWDIIGCKTATYKTEGVAPLESLRLLEQVSYEKSLGRKVLVYLHWDYELEVYPQPTHRNLAIKLIDAGADIILGCHSHCIQGFEKYKNKYIFYGLGNTVFDENYFFDGKLSFPAFCKTGLAVDWNPGSGQVLVTTTTYKDDILVVSDFVEPKSLRVINKLSEFSNMNSKEYLEFFKKNRRKKNLLPVFSETDTSMTYRVKRHFLFFRAKVIKKLFVLGIKGGSR